MGNTPSGGFPFDVGQSVDKGPVWEILQGTKHEDHAPVTIFRCDLAAVSGQLANAARAAVQHLRRMKQPNILSHLADAELEGKLYMITEPVSLLTARDDSQPIGQTLWGLHQLAKALAFVNSNCNLVHGNLGTHSVFVDKSGDWKLGGMELACDVNNVSSMPRAAVPSGLELAPEISRNEFASIPSNPTHAIDAFAFGKLVDVVLKGKVPPSARKAIQALTGPATRRPSPEEAVASPGFTNAYTRALTLVDEIPLLESRTEAIMALQEAMPTLPASACAYKLLPKLTEAAQLGSGSDRLEIVKLLIGASERLSKELWATAAAPLFVKLFEFNDRAVRVVLLQDLPKYASLMPPSAAASIYEKSSNGFLDASPDIRELTVKSLAHIGAILPPAVLEGSLRFIAQLLQDKEPGIRTNTIVCLARLAPNLSADTRARVLAAAFTRSLRDAFAPARAAALRGLVATLRFHSAADIAQKIVPAAGPLLADADPTVRAAAGDCLRQSITATEAAIEARTSQSPETLGLDETGGRTQLLRWAVSSVASVGGALVQKVVAGSGAAATPAATSATAAKPSTPTTQQTTASVSKPTSAPATTSAPSAWDNDGDSGWDVPEETDWKPPPVRSQPAPSSQPKSSLNQLAATTRPQPAPEPVPVVSLSSGAGEKKVGIGALKKSSTGFGSKPASPNPSQPAAKPTAPTKPASAGEVDWLAASMPTNPFAPAPQQTQPSRTAPVAAAAGNPFAADAMSAGSGWGLDEPAKDGWNLDDNADAWDSIPVSKPAAPTAPAQQRTATSGLPPPPPPKSSATTKPTPAGIRGLQRPPPPKTTATVPQAQQSSTDGWDTPEW
eukprot:TRINITY_DN235_c0_g1_i2.p1 TRINITY_DN235_c0_g1~~TRINITY_DN235_c0_g1_i2.p1  ORF type:complete len:842 (-),score=197.27 TRINITY_DN235_c0_g1_i2:15-2540(-)